MDKEPTDKRPMPVDDVFDMFISRGVTADHPEDAYYAASVTSRDLIEGLAGGDIDATAATVNHVGFGLALTRQLIDCPAFSNTLVCDRNKDPYDNRYIEKYTPGLITHGVNIERVKTAAEEYAITDVLEYFTSRLEELTAYLATGAELSDRPPLDSMDELKIADVLSTAVKVLPESVEDGEVWQQRFNQVIADLSSTLIEHDKVGLGISFGDLNTTREWSERFVPQLVNKLEGIKDVDDGYYFRKRHNFATNHLHEPHLGAFVAQLEKETAQPILGGQIYVSNNPLHPNIFERFEKGELRWVRLSDGSRMCLPETKYLMRTIWDPGTVREDETYETQVSVDYDELNDAERAAIEMAILVDDEGLLRTETLPNYKRLALWPDNEGDRLYTVIHQDGYNRLMNLYPDHHGFVTSDTERKLDMPVNDAVIVSDGFLVTRNNGETLSTYRDSEVNFFGPQDGTANAFWISSNPRQIYSKTDMRLSVQSESDGLSRENRFVILPVRFLKITEDKEAAALELITESEALIRSLGGIVTSD